MEKLFELLNQSSEEVVEIRRYLHQYPELSHEEVETPKYIAAYHEKLGHEVRTGVGGRGVVAKLVGGKPGKTVALRADFDALAIQEQNDVPYKSKFDGKMHACGHDGHTATLLVLAKALNKMKDDISGTIVFIHQFGEEQNPGGAKPMIEDGCLDGVDVIYGTHLWATEPTGNLMIKDGPFMAATDGFKITIQGKGGHGAEPHNTNDAIVMASQFVLNAQSIVSRRVNPIKPAVISICSFEAVNPFNVIADHVKIKGTVRTFDDETRYLIQNEMEELLKSITYLPNASYKFEYNIGYDAVINDKEATDFLLQNTDNIPGVENVRICDPNMGGEDFCYYLQHVPGSFFFTGALSPDVKEVYPHHHPNFDIDENAMLIAARTLGKVTLAYLEKHSS